MYNNPYSCDRERKEALEHVNWLGPGLDSIIALERYFAKVDDRSRTNNYCELVKEATKDCKKISNGKLWTPIPALMNPYNLIEELDLKWPKRAEQNRQRAEYLMNEIEDAYQKKGLKSTAIAGVRPNLNQYKPLDKSSQSKQDKPKQSSNSNAADEEYDPILDDERLKNIDKNIAQRILNEVVHRKQDTKWEDIAGLENVKQAINEIVVYPMQNPELFQGLLAPAKGLLLFGPPGTGKTLIGKCIACESGATFFAISASSLTSKWVGEGEKMVRALFAVARVMQPSVVFIDEIDSLLTHRTDGEHDSSRRMKTEFLVQFDGVATGAEDRLLIVGATNRPQELDEAARRRFTKRLYIPLPENSARKQIIKSLMAKAKNCLTEECINYVAEKSIGYSGADMATLCKEAALGSVRVVIRARGGAKNIANDDIPAISRSDFEAAFRHVKASVGGSDLGLYEEWDRKYGATREMAQLEDDF